MSDYSEDLKNSEMRLVDFIEQALLKSIGTTRALIIIEATNKDSFSTALNSLLYRFKGTKTCIKIMSVIGLNQIAGEIQKGNESTFNEILDKLTDGSAFNIDFDKDVKILSTINKIKNASVGTKMFSKIDALMIVNNLCHESIQIHDYKQTIIE